MASTFSFSQDNGVQTGSPAKGATRTASRTDSNWKAIDDSTTAYSASPILAGTNSFTVFQFGVFGGSFNTLSNCLWCHSAGTFGTGITLKGTVTSQYLSPSQTTNAALTTDMTAPIAIAGGLPVLFSTTDPSAASPTATLTAAGFSQYLVTQMQVSTSALPGDTVSGCVLSVQYFES